MIIFPKEKPVAEHLNAYYLDITRLLEHYQGEIGSGGVYFKSAAAEGVIFFDKDDLLNGFYKEKDLELSGLDAIERLRAARDHFNFIVSIYKISLDEVYFWASLPCAEKIYKNLSTEFTDLEGLIKKMSSEKLTGYIDVSIGQGKESGFIFIINGKIIGSSFSWSNGEINHDKKNQERLIRKTKESGGTFNVCRIPQKEMTLASESREFLSKTSGDILLMLEEFLEILESTVTAQKKLKDNFTKLLKKKFVENAEKYAFLDPFAGEFEYANGTVSFSGETGDHDLVDGVIVSGRELANELGVLPTLSDNLTSWYSKYSQQLKHYGVRF